MRQLKLGNQHLVLFNLFHFYSDVYQTGPYQKKKWYCNLPSSITLMSQRLHYFGVISNIRLLTFWNFYFVADSDSTKKLLYLLYILILYRVFTLWLRQLYFLLQVCMKLKNCRQKYYYNFQLLFEIFFPTSFNEF